MISFNLTAATRAGLNLVGLGCVVAGLYLGSSIFIPTILAALLAALLWPAAQWLHQRLRVPWAIACILVVSGVIVANMLITLGFTLAITRIALDLPIPKDDREQVKFYKELRAQLETKLPPAFMEEYFPRIKDDDPIYMQLATIQESNIFKLGVQVALNPDPEKGYLVPMLWYLAKQGNNWFWQWLYVMFILLFLMLEGRMLSRRLVEIFGPSREAQDKALEALSDMARSIRAFLVWRTIINFSLALVVGVVYYFLDLKYSWIWALLTAVAFYIPYIGPLVAAIPPVIDALLSCPTPWYAVGIIIFYVIVIMIEGYLVVPVVMGRSMELNATTVMLACLFWELVWGLPGLFLAMPLMAALRTICYHVPGWRPWANLMGTRETDPAEEEPSALAKTIFLDDEFQEAAEAATRGSDPGQAQIKKP